MFLVLTLMVLGGYLTIGMIRLLHKFLAWRRNRKFKNGGLIFNHDYIETKSLFLARFGQIPSVSWIGEMNVAQALAHIQNRLASQIVDVFQACHFNRKEGVQQFSATVVVLRNSFLIELSGQHVELLYTQAQRALADELVRDISGFKVEVKEEDYEINIITAGFNGLELKRLDIKPTVLDMDLFYNDDFRAVDAIIRERLGRQDDKGIILLHGLPGTGKTTYLRHLIGGLNKKVLFVSPSVAANLMNPEFIDLLIDNPNAVLVIEDAENIIMDRKYNSTSSVSNLLNLSDGLLSDCLNVQIICTFNSALSMVDEALLRKGRLIAKYAFGKLSVDKAQKLSAHFGLSTVIREAMTLAEVLNPTEPSYVEKKVQIGFQSSMAATN